MTPGPAGADSASNAPAPPPAHSRRRVLGNTLALALGRNLVAISRLVVIALMVRHLGTTVFGEYAVLIALLTVAEGVVDFGSSEVAVREIARQPALRQHLLRVLTASRFIQVPLAFALLMVVVLALGYPTSLLEAAAVGGLSLACLGGALVFRVLFRVDLTMARDMAAELASVVVMVAGVLWAAHSGGGILSVMAAYTLSRLVYFVAGMLLARRQFRLSVQGVQWADLRSSAVACSAIGAAGFLVMVYDPLDVLMLSKLGSVQDVALYSAAQRLAWPLLMVLSAVGGTLYSVVAAAWPHDRARAQAACQRGLDVVVLLGTLALTCTLAGAELLLQLIGPAVTEGAAALRVLMALCLVKAVSMTIGPVLLVLREQRSVLAFIALALVAKAALIFWAAPRHGILGVAWAALVVELVCVMLPSLVLVARRSGLRLHYGLSLRVLAFGLASAGAALALAGGPSLLAAVLGPLLYLGLLAATGMLRPWWRDLKELRGART